MNDDAANDDATPGQDSLLEAELPNQPERRADIPIATTHDIAAAENRTLVHSLQTHKIELELQNEELLCAQTTAQSASEKYHSLVDFLPVAYFLWDGNAKIIEANKAGAELLGMNRHEVIGKRFGQFLAMESREDFADFCRRAPASIVKQTCTVKLSLDAYSRDGHVLESPSRETPSHETQSRDLLIEGIAAHDLQVPEGTLCRAAVIDITQQRRADDLLVQNQELFDAKRRAEAYRDRYADLYDNAPLAYVTLTDDGVIHEVNLTGAVLLACERDVLRGTAFSNFVGPADQDAFREHLKRCCRWQSEATCELTIVAADCRAIDVQVHTIPASDAETGRVFCRSAITDITERKKAEIALRESETKYRSLFDNMLEGFVYCRVLTNDEGEPEDLLVLAVNDAFSRLTGLADVVGQKATEIVPGIKVATPQLFEACYRVAESGEPNAFDIDFTPLGKWFSLSIYRPAPGHFVVVFDDITVRQRADLELKENRLRLASIVGSAMDAILSVDASRKIVLFNSAAKTMFRCTEAEAMGQPLERFIPDRFRSMLADDLRELTQRQTTPRTAGRILSLSALRSDGEEFPVEASISHVEVDGQKIMTAIVRDVTERKRAEAAVQEAKAAAEAASAAKGQFLANMSHELRTPMNAILGMINVALPKSSNPAVIDCLQTAKSSADLLLTLLNNLLDSAKIESGKLALETAPFSLRKMLEQTTRILSLRASEKGLSFSCHVAPDTPDTVVGDRMRLQQVLLNLAGNAIKFTERGQVEISLARKTDSLVEEGFAIFDFAVRDTGIGINAADLKQLFRPFVQADVSMSRRFGGTGLGLSICKSFVDLMGGNITVESDVGQGSTFRFDVGLPLSTITPAEFAERAAIAGLTTAPLYVLLAEDNRANQKLAVRILRDRGHRIDVADDGRAAFTMSQQRRYDVILMDVQMPEMDGLEATIAIRTWEGGRRRVPILAMTAHALTSDRDRCLAAGMDAYLSKPIAREELLETVERMGNKGWGRMDWKSDLIEANMAENRARQGTEPEATQQTTLANESGAPNSECAIVSEPVAAGDVRAFNLEGALARLGGEERLFHDMIGYFFSEGWGQLRELDEAVKNGDERLIERKAHLLKGTLLYLGAEPAIAALAELDAARQEPGMKGADAALRAANAEVHKLATALKAYQASADDRP